MAVTLVLVVGPLLLGLAGLLSSRRAAADPTSSAAPWDWSLTAKSVLLYTLSFNLTFFVQEFFLVLSKALTPGLRATLYHNNHRWEGGNPLASLMQGTGATAIFLAGITCAFLLARGAGRSITSRLFLIWMTYNGFMQSLPQVIIGAVEPENDVGMAMNYLHFGAALKTAAAFIALVLIPLVGLSLTGSFLGLAQDSAQTASARARIRFVFLAATLPAMTAILLIIPFRVPRSWIEVALVPVVVTGTGISWLQFGAWRVSATAKARPGGISEMYLLGAVLILFLVFQLVLRPGIHFY
ncbi:MAG TPA: hypothetical protein VGI90_16265 [Steroidobacteraceae bacterium]|jgi:hypothetical protein